MPNATHVSPRRTAAAAAAAIAGAVFAAQTARAATVYSTRQAFAAAVRPGSYTESFDSLGDGDLKSPTLTFASGGYSFTASTGATLPDDDNLFGNDGSTATDFTLSTTVPHDLTFTFPGGNVTAVGGDFSLADTNFRAAADTFTLTLSDGTVVTRTSGGTNTPFFGFTTFVPITSLTVGVPADATANNYYATVNNLTVGTAVPEPAGLAAAAAGAVGLLRRRRVAVAR